MAMDISQTSLRKYLDKFYSDHREGVANIVCNGEAFENAIDSDKVKILLDVIGESVIRETASLLALVKDGKYIDNEELRRIRQHCIAINSIDGIVRDWESRLSDFNRHLERMDE